MKNTVKEFIEEHINLIDTENWSEFCSLIWSWLQPNEAKELVQVLKDSGIEFDSARRDYFNFVLTMQFEGARDQGVKRITIQRFLAVYGGNKLGFSDDEVINILLEDQSEFDIHIADDSYSYIDQTIFLE